MSAMTQMARLWVKERRRYEVAVYRCGQNFIKVSKDWGGRYSADGSVSRGIGFQVGLNATCLEVIIWPRSVVLYSQETRKLEPPYVPKVVVTKEMFEDRPYLGYSEG